MKYNFKKSISVLIVCSVLSFQGCGGGSGSGDGGSGDGGSGDGTDYQPAGNTFKYNRISIAGSSITWGEGYLGEKSYVGEVIEYFREDVADTVGPGELTTPDSTITDLMSYKGQLNVYNAGSEITGTLEASDAVSIVFAGSGQDTTVEMEVDGTVCGSYTIQGTFKPVKVISPDNDVDSTSGNVRSFRETEPQSVAKICENLENKAHDFKLTVKSGELHLNFITNHMYYFQNAGIGGYAASTILGGANAWFPNTTTTEIVDFDPDFFILESSTNDANTWSREASGGASTNNWKIETPQACTIEDNVVKGLSTSGIVQGDVVVLGNYSGDIRNMSVGIVDNISGNDIVLDRTVVHNYENNMTICRVKDISSWTDNVEEIVQKVKDGVEHSLTVGIGTSGVPNYYAYNGPNAVNSGFPRRLMGYREKGIEMANENGWMFYDFFNKVKAFNPGIDNDSNPNNRWSYGDNTHPNEENGYRLFGEAVTDVLTEHFKSQ